MKITKKTLLPFLIILFLLVGNYFFKTDDSGQPLPASDQVLQAYAGEKSNIQVQGSGTVIKLLADDRRGSQHQKFIVRVASDLTILIAHNIDLAPRIDSLQTGERVEFLGEYEWNPRGGVVHWTHRDPQSHHQDGWLKYKNRIYQ
jgi:hypothetical protein